MYHADFSRGVPGGLPEGWTLHDFGSHQGAPRIGLKTDGEGPYLSLAGGGDPLGNAYALTTVKLEPGTYLYRARFSFSPGLNPQRNLLFQCHEDSIDGIFKFYRLDNGMAEGRDTIVITGKKEMAELKIYFRFSAEGEVKLRSLSLVPAEPVKPRWARFACTSGHLTQDHMAAAAAMAAQDGADLLLYPELVTHYGENAPSAESTRDLMAGLAAKHHIYTAASLYLTDEGDGHQYNRGLLFDRQGALTGVYDKIHPYSPESTGFNISPGTKTDVFKTDFGKVGMIICYDSWFVDVTQLLALKGAEVILFPVAGYYRSLFPARAADNRVRFVISVQRPGDGYGIYDTAGRDVENPDKDPTVRIEPGVETFKDVKTFDVDDEFKMLCASLDLNCSISPHYNGGRMWEAPGGKRNRGDQVLYLDDMIKAEKERWWENG